MIVVSIILFVWILIFGARLAKQSRYLELLAIQNKQLEEINAMLLTRCASPDVDVSNFTDCEAAISFAIQCGYVGAVTGQNVKEDHSRRAGALRDSLEYYRRHISGVVALANH